ncbi:TonB-dependent receptor [Sphingomonas sp.]|uniref:TonB-dependent receptor plug domain-containing protein n=1 Tax=Sphingomonas sp. TaxID=28214 RepID=UPI0025E8A1BD|nr:TonB-dependent receptor [Sphingomonas sp.]
MGSRAALTLALIYAGMVAPTTANATPGSTEQAGAETKGDSANEVIVTGTRSLGMLAVESPSPIQLLDDSALKRVGQNDLIQALAQNLPSVQAQAFGGNVDAFHLSFKLRGLNPNHTLVLINGKRRHGTANISVSGGAYNGNAAADISLIPVDSIARVEILQDGAAAQYGTDAIAGVINIIQKKDSSGGVVTANAGQYFDGGGRTWDVAGNIGIEPFEGAYLNLTAERRYHGYSFRGNLDPRVINTGVAGNSGATLLARFPTLVNAPDYPYVNRISGDPKYDLATVTYNGGYDLGSGIELYSFGSYAHRTGRANENYRLPNVVVGVSATDIPFPYGFTPQQVARETDYSFTGGVSGSVDKLNWDLSTTYGNDKVNVAVENTANASLYSNSSTATRAGTTPRDFHAGDFIASQWTTNLDLTRAFDIGLAEPVNVAAGIEYRREIYEIVAGDPTSYYGTGSQSFQGYAPVNAGRHGRHDWSEYLDVSVRPVEKWLIDAAVRHEDYSDFGSTTVVKGTTRYDFTPAIAVRGTASTGFRAPTLAEEYYSGIGVGPTQISGVFAPNSPGASSLGIPGLKPEKSTNFSAGLVLRPAPRLRMTLDGYSIELRHRIVQSGTFFGYNSNRTVTVSPSVIQALLANGVTIDPAIYSASSGSIGVTAFVNGLNTRTRGIDFVANYASDFGSFGTVDWSLTANYNKTKITNLGKPPSNVNQGILLLDAAAQSTLVKTTPKVRATAGAFWSLGRLSLNLRESYYGRSYQLIQNPVLANYEKAEVNGKFITDIELSYKLFNGLKLSAGANNLFNTYPTKIPASLMNAYYSISSSSYATQYPRETALNISGGYYYGRATFSF